MADALSVLAKEATVEQCVEVFRAEDGWEPDCDDFQNEEWLAKRTNHDEIEIRIAITLEGVLAGDESFGWVFKPWQDTTTLGDLLRIANELAATEFCGGWKEGSHE